MRRLGGGTHSRNSLIEQGVTRLQSLRGASSHQINPFTAVLGEDCTEDIGECYGAQLVYSGSFTITAEKRFNGSVRLQGGVNATTISRFSVLIDTILNVINASPSYSSNSER